VKLAGSNSVPVPQERAYALLRDPAVLVKCMPGCEALDRAADNEYTMRMNMALASISGRFSGKVTIADANPPSAFRLIVEGSGKIGFMKGDGVLTLTPDGGITQVQFEGDVHVGGLIANVGQRLVATTAKLLIKRFFACLGASVASQIATQPAPAQQIASP
jgi:uncharacterized protein